MATKTVFTPETIDLLESLAQTDDEILEELCGKSAQPPATEIESPPDGGTK